MILSTRGRYGLKAMFELGLHYGKGPIPLKIIAERQCIPENYLEQLIAILRKAGLVKSVRGAQGGYLMLRPPDQVTVAQVLLALEGPLAPAECVADPEAPRCRLADECVTRSVWEKIRVSIHDVIDAMTLQHMIEEQLHLHAPTSNHPKE
ncbi:RrF2 family transcriptional regulator [Anoxynatronum buryatiense]|uniref:Transcriptional regulator, BadM/Rrf2 family n=1 Tax=Anoxynatronum buryatiense TaxID=489973 RepID=A0AA46AIH8_9CLOT|nr:Rrf2 family transcriptional regulator [Anoxynatronum buryatiense]SMP49057.1 transcriptional regulator, BadM/Rrf2 family [Anoxynatronum buryatiense]